MSKREVRIFVSSPNDMAEQRKELDSIVDELNSTLGVSDDCVITLLQWARDVVPGAGRPQDVITRQIGRYDIYLGMMFKRFGSPPGKKGVDSGTEEEFEDAYKRWERYGTVRVMFYFCTDPVEDLSDEEFEQYAKVRQFRAKVQGRMLAGYYNRTDRPFRPLVKSHLIKTIKGVLAAKVDEQASEEFSVFLANVTGYQKFDCRAIRAELVKMGVKLVQLEDSATEEEIIRAASTATLCVHILSSREHPEEVDRTLRISADRAQRLVFFAPETSGPEPAYRKAISDLPKPEGTQTREEQRFGLWGLKGAVVACVLRYREEWEKEHASKIVISYDSEDLPQTWDLVDYLRKESKPQHAILSDTWEGPKGYRDYNNETARCAALVLVYGLRPPQGFLELFDVTKTKVRILAVYLARPEKSSPFGVNNRVQFINNMTGFDPEHETFRAFFGPFLRKNPPDNQPPNLSPQPDDAPSARPN